MSNDLLAKRYGEYLSPISEIEVDGSDGSTMSCGTSFKSAKMLPPMGPWPPKAKDSLMGRFIRAFRPSTQTFEAGWGLVKYQCEPGFTGQSDGIHAPASSRYVVGPPKFNHSELKYAPLNGVLDTANLPGLHKSQFKTAISYANQRAFEPDGRPARYPIPRTLRRLGAAVSKGFDNLKKGRLSTSAAPASAPPLHGAAGIEHDRALADESALKACISQMFAADGEELRTLFVKLRTSGLHEGQAPVPRFMQHLNLAEALAAATANVLKKDRVRVACEAIDHLSRGLQLDRKNGNFVQQPGQAAKVAWRTAQILATCGGDDVLVALGAVPPGTDSPTKRQEILCSTKDGEARVRERRHQAMRVFLQATAQITDTRADKSPFFKAEDLAQGGSNENAERSARAALKLWADPDPRVERRPTKASGDDDRLTGQEKNAYYEWLQGCGRPGCLDSSDDIKRRLAKTVTHWVERAHVRGMGDSLTEGTKPSRAALDLGRRALGFNKSPLTALQGGVLNAHLRYEPEVREQYQTFSRALLQALSPVVHGDDAKEWCKAALQNARRGAFDAPGGARDDLSLEKLKELLDAAGMLGDEELDPAVQKEFGLHKDQRYKLDAGMAPNRLHGAGNEKPITASNLLDRLFSIRAGDKLRPVVPSGADHGQFVDALKEFNDMYIREQVLSVRVRALDGGLYGMNNLGLALNYAGLPIAPDLRLGKADLGYWEYNSHRGAFEIAFGTMKDKTAGIGLSAGVDGLLTQSALSFNAAVNAGIDWLDNEGVCLRGRRELDEYSEQLWVSDDEFRRTIAPARDEEGHERVVDVSGDQPRWATKVPQQDGSTAFQFDDGKPAPESPEYERGCVFLDDGSSAHGVARLEKGRHHLMEATDFLFDQAKRGHNMDTRDHLWNAWVDKFFDNPNVSVTCLHHRHAGISLSGQVSGSARGVLDGSPLRPGGAASAGYTRRPYEAQNRSDGTGMIQRTLVQVGYSGVANAGASLSVGLPPVELSNPAEGVDPLNLPAAKAVSGSVTLADRGIQVVVKFMQEDGKIMPGLAFCDVWYRDLDTYLEYAEKNRPAWEALLGKENFDKRLAKAKKYHEVNQRFTEHWALSDEAVHLWRSRVFAAKAKQIAAREAGSPTEAQEHRIEAQMHNLFAADMLEDRRWWDPMADATLDQQFRERLVGASGFVQLQHCLKIVAQGKADFIGANDAKLNEMRRARRQSAKDAAQGKD